MATHSPLELEGTTKAKHSGVSGGSTSPARRKAPFRVPLRAFGHNKDNLDKCLNVSKSKQRGQKAKKSERGEANGSAAPRGCPLGLVRRNLRGFCLLKLKDARVG